MKKTVNKPSSGVKGSIPSSGVKGSIPSSERKRFMTVTVYDAEKYARDVEEGKTRGMGIKSNSVDITGLTDAQIDKLIQKVKDDQKLANIEYRKINPRSRGRRPKPIIYLNTEEGILPLTPEKKAEASVDSPEERILPSRGEGEILPIIPFDNKAAAFDDNTGNTFVLFGSSKSGKSTLMMKIYNTWFKDQKSILTTLFAMNPQIEIYSKGRASKYLIKSDKFDANCNKYVDWQRKVNKDNENKFHFLNMFDDFIDVRYNKLMNNLILTYRNSNMSAIICLQYAKLLSKAARGNINNVLLLSMNTDEAIVDVINSFLLGTIKRNKFVDELDSVAWYRDKTSNYNYIHINPLHRFIYFSKTKEMFTL